MMNRKTEKNKFDQSCKTVISGAIKSVDQRILG